MKKINKVVLSLALLTSIVTPTAMTTIRNQDNEYIGINSIKNPNEIIDHKEASKLKDGSKLDINSTNASYGDLMFKYNLEQKILYGNFSIKLGSSHDELNTIQFKVENQNYSKNITNVEIKNSGKNATGTFLLDLSDFTGGTLSFSGTGITKFGAYLFTDGVVDFVIEGSAGNPFGKDIITYADVTRGETTLSGTFDIDNSYPYPLTEYTISATPTDIEGATPIIGYVNLINKKYYIPTLLEDTDYTISLTVNRSNPVTTIETSTTAREVTKISNFSSLSTSHDSATIAFTADESMIGETIILEDKTNGIRNSIKIDSTFMTYTIHDLNPNTVYSFIASHNNENLAAISITTLIDPIIDQESEAQIVGLVQSGSNINVWTNFFQGIGTGSKTNTSLEILFDGAVVETINLDTREVSEINVYSPTQAGTYTFNFVADEIVKDSKEIIFTPLINSLLSNFSVNSKDDSTKFGLFYNKGQGTANETITISFTSTSGLQEETINLNQGYNKISMGPLDQDVTTNVTLTTTVSGLPTTVIVNGPTLSKPDVSGIEVLVKNTETAYLMFDIDDSHALGLEKIKYTLTNLDSGQQIYVNEIVNLSEGKDYGFINLVNLTGSTNYQLDMDIDGNSVDSTINFQTSEYIEGEGAILDITEVDTSQNLYNVEIKGNINTVLSQLEYKVPGGEFTEFKPISGVWQTGNNQVIMDLKGNTPEQVEWSVKSVKDSIAELGAPYNLPKWVIPTASVLGALLAATLGIFGFLLLKEKKKQPVRMYELHELKSMTEEELDVLLIKWKMNNEDIQTIDQKIESLEHVYVYQGVVRGK